MKLIRVILLYSALIGNSYGLNLLNTTTSALTFQDSNFNTHAVPLPTGFQKQSTDRIAQVAKLITGSSKAESNNQIAWLAKQTQQLFAITHYTMGIYGDLPRRISAPGEHTFVFSPRMLRWAAYDKDGYRVASGKANGGANYCPELRRACHTPRGIYRIQRKGTASCVSKRFPMPRGGAPMPYCMYFGNGFAIHGSPYISNGNTSHGCIRVYTGAAQWLHQYFIHPGTKVIVLSY